VEHIPAAAGARILSRLQQKQTAYRILWPSAKRRWPRGKVTCGTAVKCSPLSRPRSNTPASHWHRGRRATGKSKCGIRMTNHPSGVSRLTVHGLLRPEDWHAQWIAHPKAAQCQPSTPHNTVDGRLLQQWVRDIRDCQLPMAAIQLRAARLGSQQEVAWAYPPGRCRYRNPWRMYLDYATGVFWKNTSSRLCVGSTTYRRRIRICCGSTIAATTTTTGSMAIPLPAAAVCFPGGKVQHQVGSLPFAAHLQTQHAAAEASCLSARSCERGSIAEPFRAERT